MCDYFREDPAARLLGMPFASQIEFVGVYGVDLAVSHSP